MKKISKEILDEIEQRNEISEVISSYVSLKKAGSTMKGLCPFHSEKSPSFTVYPNSNSFYCFGCGAGGSVFTFIMKAENLDFYGAAEFLADRVGIRIPDNGIEKQESGITKRKVFEINLEAAKYFRACLFDERIGKEAMSYLTENRKLTGAVIRHFGLGYAPDSFSAFGQYMRGKGYTNEELKECDLLSFSEKNKNYYSRFRNRVMFPIIDVSGNIIGFGGRVMDDTKPKYLNSSDTPGFKKSKNLFALNYAKDNISDGLILCEGYMDVIAMHSAGFENAVATLGTAITSEQARLISRYTKKVILIYDSDEAGRKADERAMRLLGEVGIEVRVLKLQGAKDPDEFIKKYGKSKLSEALKNSQNEFVYKMESIISRYNIEETSEKVMAIKEVLNVIASVGSGVEREVYIGITSKRFGINEDSAKNDVEKYRRGLIREFKQNQTKSIINTAKKYGDLVNKDAVKNVIASSAEDVILGLMIMSEEIRNLISEGQISLDIDDFFTEFGKKVFRIITDLQRSEVGFNKEELQQELTADEYGRIVVLEQNRRSLSDNNLTILKEAVETLKKEKKLNDEINSGNKLALLMQKRNNKKR